MIIIIIIIIIIITTYCEQALNLEISRGYAHRVTSRFAHFSNSELIACM